MDNDAFIDYKTMFKDQVKIVDRLQSRIAELERHNDDWKSIVESNNKYIKELEQFKQEALEMAVSMHIDTMAWNLHNEENTPREILVGWHESNNKKLEQFLAKWKVVK